MRGLEEEAMAGAGGRGSQGEGERELYCMPVRKGLFVCDKVVWYGALEFL